MSNSTLPWAGDSNVKCTLERSSDGTVTGTCTITRPGTEPIVMKARASEREIAGWLLRRYQELTGQAPDGATAGQLQARVSNAAKQRVLRRLAAAYRKVKRMPSQGPATCPAAAAFAARARQLLARAKQGDKAARAAISGISARAAAGDTKAKRDQRILLAVAGEYGASSGWSDVYSPAVMIGSVAYDADVMDLENYYQIAGQHARTCQGCAPGTQCAGCASSSGDSDLVIGADGKAYVRGWDGVKWIWRELGPRRTIRGEQGGFGIRDALLLGMRTVQSRELSATA